MRRSSGAWFVPIVAARWGRLAQGVLALSLVALMTQACAAVPPAPTPAAPTPAALTPAAQTPAAPTPAATPMATDLAGVAARVIHLGGDATPIDVAFAFGSIWVASHHFNAVIRIDPDTLTEVARIEVGNGPGWFAVTNDAVWVTLQLGRGLARIDPMKNTSEVGAGMWATCFSPVVAFGSIWQAACDAHQVMRIDPMTYVSTDITVGDQNALVLAGDQLLSGGPLGLSRIDPATNTIETIGGQAGRAIGYAGGTVWISDGTQVFRVDARTGAVLSTLPISYAWIVTEHDGRAWVVQESTAVLRIDLDTNEIVQTLPVRPEPIVAREAAGALWVTSYGGDSLWRFELPSPS